MFCPQCGKDLPDGAAFCNGCGRSLSATSVTDKPESAMAYTAPRAPQTPAPAAHHQQFQMDFQFNRLGVGDLIVGGASLVLMISYFLPWYTASFNDGFGTISGSASAMDINGWLYLCFFVILALVGYLVARALSPKVRLPLPHWQALLGVTGFDALLTLIGFATKPSGSSFGFGAFLGIIAAIAAVVGAIVRRNQPEVLPAA